MDIREGDRVRMYGDPDRQIMEVVRVDGEAVTVRDASGEWHPGITWRMSAHDVRKVGE